MNSNTPSLAITMKGVSPLIRPEATSGSDVTPMLSAAADHHTHCTAVHLTQASALCGANDTMSSPRRTGVACGAASKRTSIPKRAREGCSRVHGIRCPQPGRVPVILVLCRPALYSGILRSTHCRKLSHKLISYTARQLGWGSFQGEHVHTFRPSI